MLFPNTPKHSLDLNAIRRPQANVILVSSTRVLDNAKLSVDDVSDRRFQKYTRHNDDRLVKVHLMQSPSPM